MYIKAFRYADTAGVYIPFTSDGTNMHTYDSWDRPRGRWTQPILKWIWDKLKLKAPQIGWFQILKNTISTAGPNMCPIGGCHIQVILIFDSISSLVLSNYIHFLYRCWTDIPIIPCLTCNDTVEHPKFTPPNLGWFVGRRKFRSQTSDTMDRWKEVGRAREEKTRKMKIREEKESEERRCRCAKR